MPSRESLQATSYFFNVTKIVEGLASFSFLFFFKPFGGSPGLNRVHLQFGIVRALNYQYGTNRALRSEAFLVIGC